MPYTISINRNKEYLYAFTFVTFSILLSICNLGVGLNSKQIQRQDTNGYSGKLHLLTLRLINNPYHNTVEQNWIKHWSKNVGEKP